LASRTANADAGAPILDVDLFAPASLLDPYPVYERLRAAGPLFQLAPYGACGVARYQEVRAVLDDWQTFCSSAGVGLTDYRKEKPWRVPGLLLEADPPVHTRSRAVITRVLSGAAVRRLRAEFEAQADRLIDELCARGDFDAVKDLAEAYPLKVFADAVGLPAGNREKLLAYGDMIFNAFGPQNDLFHAAVAAADQYQDWVAQSCSRTALAPGSFGAQIYAAADAGELTEDEAPRLVRAFLSAGLDTTVAALGNAILLFAWHPEQWGRLHANPALARAAFEEVLRYEAPFQMLFRTTTKATEISGRRIAAGEKVLVVLAAANRDPAQWPQPDRFDLARRAGAHLAFGSGIHACIGQTIARLEGEIVLTALARKVARIELAGTPQRRLNNTLRALKSLPVRLYNAPH
jgi:cytochrome P450